MARIDAEELGHLKASADLVQLVRDHGVDLTAGGDDHRGRCPFGSHADETPSFHVSASKQVFHCFGCGESGDVIAWLQKSRGISFRNAVELLRAHGKALPASDVAAHAGKLPPIVTPEMSDADALAAVVAYYAERLALPGEGRNYALGRGLLAATLKEHRVGVCDRTLAFRLSASTTKAGKQVRETLTRVGILKENGREFFLGCITFPVLDENGAVVGLYGRRYAETQRDAPKHLYLKGPQRGAFNVAAVNDADSVLLCECIIDALTLVSAGFPNVTCTYGVAGMPDELWNLLTHKKQILFAFDRDDAGNSFARKYAEKLLRMGKDCRRVLFPMGMDVNGFAKKNGLGALAEVVRNAVWMGEEMEPVEEAVPAVTTGSEAAERKAAGEEKATEAAATVEASTALVPAAMTAAATTTTPPMATTMVPAPTTEVAPIPSPMKPTPTTALHPGVTLHDDELTFVLRDRRYKVLGLEDNRTKKTMRVHIQVRSERGMFMDTFDLQMSKPRMGFVKAAATELDVSEELMKQELAELFGVLETVRDGRIEAAQSTKPKVPELTEEEREEALHLLQDPSLVGRILEDFERCGVVGEETNKLVGYLAAVSRKLERPLAILINSLSGSGKSSVMDAVLAFMPPEETERYSTMTSQSLYYFTGTDLKHRILALSEEEGAERVSYALKLLQSEGKLSIASTGKDPATGKLQTARYEVEGPVMVFLTSTHVKMDEELQNRCLVLSVDESREQTRRILAAQRRSKTEDGLRDSRAKPHILKLHQNAQRLLERYPVYMPFGSVLSFPDERTRMRRDQPKYFALIEASTLLHQFQRKKRPVRLHDGSVVEALVAQLEDVEIANRLAVEVLGKTLDALAPPTRRLLMEIRGMVLAAAERDQCDPGEVRLTRRDVREFTGWSEAQVRSHTDILLQHEYLVAHRGSHGQTFVYELLWDGRGHNGEAFVSGLLSVEQLRERMDKLAGQALREGRLHAGQTVTAGRIEAA